MPTKTPKFCAIAPTSYLEKYACQSYTHLVLAHLVDTDQTYTDFYIKMAQRGDTIILDNGAFELGESYEPSKLLELGKKCHANTIVLPDYPFQPGIKTIDAAVKYYNEIKEAGFKTLFVPQSKVGDLEDWIQTYKWAIFNPEVVDCIGMSILGIPNALPHIPKSYARVVMTQLLIDRGLFRFYKYHHYLGLNSAPNVEIPALIEMDAIDSCDSSNPIWSGINGIRYNVTNTDFMGIQKKYLREVDFNEKFVDNKTHIHDVIQYNLDVTFNIFEDHKKYL